MLKLSTMLLKHPIWSSKYFLEKIGLGRMSDEQYVQYVYERVNDGEKLNLKTPVTYDDKLNWMKLYDRRDIYTAMVDKLKVKEIVSSKIGKEHVIPLIKDSYGGVYDSFDQIDFDQLPRQFVLKTNHDCGGVFICRDKDKFNVAEVREEIERRLNTNFFYAGREWPYKNVDRKIICEEYIDNLADNNYKFFTFNGEIKAVYVAPFRERTVDYFDPEYNHLDIYTRLHQGAPTPPKRPECFGEMKVIVEKLSAGIPAVRVDLYEVDGKIYFSEFTFFHEAGFTPFLPEKWNRVFGNWFEMT